MTLTRFNHAFHRLQRAKSTISSTADPLVYQFLQRSTVPMLHFQPSLPRLPIPKLEKTCQRYLEAQRPLLTDETYRHTESLVTRFRAETGKQLQELLIKKDKANKHTSYISEPWFDMYLRDRAPLPLNFNPVLIMKHDERPAYNDQALRTANLIVTSLRFMRSLRAECLEPEVFHMNPAKSDTERFRKMTRLAPSSISWFVAYLFKAFPLDMSQYQGLFGTTRVPELDKDRIVRYEDSRHVVVMARGHFYAVDVLDRDGNVEAPEVILARVKRVVAEGLKREPAELPLGVMTTENRNRWASARHQMIESGNEAAFKLIDSALFCICLDESTIDEENPIPMVRETLFESGANRWYDKSLSLIVSKDGTTSINFEHSWGDGVAVLRYFNEIYKETTSSPYLHPESVPAARDDDSTVRRIDLKFDDKGREAIQAAARHHQSIVDAVDMNFIKTTVITKASVKKYRVSPDSVMQLGIQLAFFKQHGQFVATYESCSTAAFRHGRTETVRPCTTATRRFCEAISAKQPPAGKELRAMLDECSRVHNQLVKEAAMGQGFDRHLFGLRHMAATNDIPQPALFADPAYAAINHNVLSTSTLQSPGLLAGGFGPVVKDGYGIGYNIQDAFAGCVVANYKQERNGKEFVECLQEAYENIGEVMKH